MLRSKSLLRCTKSLINNQLGNKISGPSLAIKSVNSNERNVIKETQILKCPSNDYVSVKQTNSESTASQCFGKKKTKSHNLLLQIKNKISKTLSNQNFSSSSCSKLNNTSRNITNSFSHPHILIPENEDNFLSKKTCHISLPKINTDVNIDRHSSNNTVINFDKFKSNFATKHSNTSNIKGKENTKVKHSETNKIFDYSDNTTNSRIIEYKSQDSSHKFNQSQININKNKYKKENNAPIISLEDYRKLPKVTYEEYIKARADNKGKIFRQVTNETLIVFKDGTNKLNIKIKEQHNSTLSKKFNESRPIIKKNQLTETNYLKLTQIKQMPKTKPLNYSRNIKTTIKKNFLHKNNRSQKNNIYNQLKGTSGHVKENTISKYDELSGLINETLLKARKEYNEGSRMFSNTPTDFPELNNSSHNLLKVNETLMTETIKQKESCFQNGTPLNNRYTHWQTSPVPFNASNNALIGRKIKTLLRSQQNNFISTSDSSLTNQLKVEEPGTTKLYQRNDSIYNRTTNGIKSTQDELNSPLQVDGSIYFNKHLDNKISIDNDKSKAEQVEEFNDCSAAKPTTIQQTNTGKGIKMLKSLKKCVLNSIYTTPISLINEAETTPMLNHSENNISKEEKVLMTIYKSNKNSEKYEMTKNENKQSNIDEINVTDENTKAKIFKRKDNISNKYTTTNITTNNYFKMYKNKNFKNTLPEIQKDEDNTNEMSLGKKDTKINLSEPVAWEASKHYQQIKGRVNYTYNKELNQNKHILSDIEQQIHGTSWMRDKDYESMKGRIIYTNNNKENKKKENILDDNEEKIGSVAWVKGQENVAPNYSSQLNKLDSSENQQHHKLKQVNHSSPPTSNEKSKVTNTGGLSNIKNNNASSLPRRNKSDNNLFNFFLDTITKTTNNKNYSHTAFESKLERDTNNIQAKTGNYSHKKLTCSHANNDSFTTEDNILKDVSGHNETKYSTNSKTDIHSNENIQTNANSNKNYKKVTELKTKNKISNTAIPWVRNGITGICHELSKPVKMKLNNEEQCQKNTELNYFSSCVCENKAAELLNNNKIVAENPNESETQVEIIWAKDITTKGEATEKNKYTNNVEGDNIRNGSDTLLAKENKRLGKLTCNKTKNKKLVKKSCSAEAWVNNKLVKDEDRCTNFKIDYYAQISDNANKKESIPQKNGRSSDGKKSTNDERNKKNNCKPWIRVKIKLSSIYSDQNQKKLMDTNTRFSETHNNRKSSLKNIGAKEQNPLGSELKNIKIDASKTYSQILNIPEKGSVYKKTQPNTKSIQQNSNVNLLDKTKIIETNKNSGAELNEIKYKETIKEEKYGHLLCPTNAEQGTSTTENKGKIKTEYNNNNNAQFNIHERDNEDKKTTHKNQVQENENHTTELNSRLSLPNDEHDNTSNDNAEKKLAQPLNKGEKFISQNQKGEIFNKKEDNSSSREVNLIENSINKLINETVNTKAILKQLPKFDKVKGSLINQSINPKDTDNTNLTNIIIKLNDLPTQNESLTKQELSDTTGLDLYEDFVQEIENIDIYDIEDFKETTEPLEKTNYKFDKPIKEQFEKKYETTEAPKLNEKIKDIHKTVYDTISPRRNIELPNNCEKINKLKSEKDTDIMIDKDEEFNAYLTDTKTHGERMTEFYEFEEKVLGLHKNDIADEQNSVTQSNKTEIPISLIDSTVTTQNFKNKDRTASRDKKAEETINNSKCFKGISTTTGGMNLQEGKKQSKNKITQQDIEIFKEFQNRNKETLHNRRNKYDTLPIADRIQIQGDPIKRDTIINDKTGRIIQNKNTGFKIENEKNTVKVQKKDLKTEYDIIDYDVKEKNMNQDIIQNRDSQPINIKIGGCFSDSSETVSSLRESQKSNKLSPLLAEDSKLKNITENNEIGNLKLDQKNKLLTATETSENENKQNDKANIQKEKKQPSDEKSIDSNNKITQPEETCQTNLNQNIEKLMAEDNLLSLNMLKEIYDIKINELDVSTKNTLKQKEEKIESKNIRDSNDCPEFVQNENTAIYVPKKSLSAKSVVINSNETVTETSEEKNTPTIVKTILNAIVYTILKSNNPYKLLIGSEKTKNEQVKLSNTCSTEETLSNGAERETKFIPVSKSRFIMPINDTRFPMINNAKLSLQYPKSLETQVITLNNQMIYKHVPSVSKILNETLPQSTKKDLRKWEINHQIQWGPTQLEDLYREQLKNDIQFHDSIRRHILGTPLNVLTETADRKLKGSLISIKGVLSRLTNVKVLESPVVHPELPYHGIIDCVACYNESPTLIEWKQADRPKSILDLSYDSPVQLSAYIGGINHDQRYKFPIKDGIVVIAYTDGSPADILFLPHEDCKKYWKIWLERLNRYITSAKEQQTS